MRLQSRNLSLVPALGLTVALAGCGTIKEAIKGPNMTAMAYPAQLVGREQDIIPAYHHEESQTVASANSLWRIGARTFFNDQRASKVGDILTVLISINDSAQVSNATTRERKVGSNAAIPHLLGLESSLGRILPKGFDPTNAIDVSSDNTNSGTGTINRQDQINLTVAAVVTKVMPNGNLVIQGRQEVKTNAEIRDLTVAGLVRPEDISSSNTINHTQIAEARISYAGRGDISRIQKAPAGQSLIETFSPF
jgi:flagellar L-ring protein precursor FlgH